ncbi:hypothetical protein BY458DRAFT_520154 [Sporodiniella umbellata]|nr:hypothetical protein BY458DRAFT_520154 [Sporodiniella umbellata]
MSSEEVIPPNCQGCEYPIEEGAVVAFGDALFHIKCFVCDKCKECVENKTNLLLLDNGKPVCDDCSYNCTACNGVIRNEAIMTGDRAYHSDCFKCISCKNRIEDLIFTQTKKGIYCTKCYELRKASRKNKVKPGSLSELPLKDPPTPVRSRSNSNNAHIANSHLKNESLLSVLSPVTLSFFDNSSSEVLDNLSNSLGANLSLNFPDATSATQSRINRASEILQSSLRSSSLKQTAESQNADTSHSDIDILKKELFEARTNLKCLEADNKALQEASQQALDEFTKIKEEYAKEAMIKQQQEYIITALLRTDSGMLSKKELEKLALYRTHLEAACMELVRYRDVLSVEIDQAADKQTLSAYYANYQKSLKAQAKSIAQHRDILHSETRDLKQTRDELVHDLISLNNPGNNNSRKQETAPLPTTLSPSHSSSSTTAPARKLSDAESVICKVSSRNSFLGDQTPTLFRIKKKGSTMFNKIAPIPPPKPKPEPSLSTSSTTNSSSSSIYGLSSKFATGSLQNLSKKAGFTDSNMSLHGNHAFMHTPFIRPVKCGVCNDKIWGRSEYRCEGCGFLAHSRCLSHVPQSCLSTYPSRSASSFDLHADANMQTESKISPKGLFGFSLIERVEQEGRNVPFLVEECIRAIDRRGLDYEGIYRKSGGAAQTRAIQLAFEQGYTTDLCNEDEYNDVCAITSALKQYFRDLPEPLLTYRSYQELIDASALVDEKERLNMVRRTISQLPKAHSSTLYFLLRHLNKVCQLSSQNRMTIKNMSMIFAPTLMRHQDPSRDFLDMSYKNAAVEYLLLHTADLF